MRTIVGKRKSGKTTEVIKLAYDTGAAIVCATNFNKQCIFEKCKEMYGVHSAELMNIFTIQELYKGEHRGKQYNGIVIDDSEFVLEWLIQNMICDCGFIAQFLTPDREIVYKD